MKATLVTETYFPQINGVSRTLDQLTRFLRERGDLVQLLTPRYPGGDTAAGVRHAVFRSFPVPFYRDIRMPLTWPRQVLGTLKRFQPDIVHIATEGTLGFSALRAAQKLGVPVVTSYHTNFSSYTRSYGVGLLEKIVLKYLRWFHNSSLATLCTTGSVRHDLTRKGFRNLVVWGRGVDASLFNPRYRSEEIRRRCGAVPGQRLVLYVGRLAREKNLGMLVDCVDGLASDSRLRFAFVGDGPRGPSLKRRLNGSAHFAGALRGTELARHYAAGDLLVFPSLTETFGNVVLEAMASGLPVVAFDAPGPRDIIRSGRTGILMDDISSESLRRGILESIADAVHLRRMSENARRYAVTQGWESVNRIVRETYCSVLRGTETERLPAAETMFRENRKD